MKTFLSALAAVALLAAASQPATFAQGNPKAEIEQVIRKFQEKANAGKREPADYADELKELDALYASHKGEKTDDVATFLLAKANVYAQLFEDIDQATVILQELQKEFPGTESSKSAESFLAALAVRAEAMKIQKSLSVGSAFPDFSETGFDGKPLSISQFKGKVVLVDFWATWCPPCVAELPHILDAYEKYHAQGFEIVGISLDEEKEALTGFLKENKIPWPQYFDGKGPQNKLAIKYGNTRLPTTFLLDREGIIVAQDLRGEELDAAIVAAVAKK